MKNLILVLAVLWLNASCSEVEPDKYLNTVSYPLYQASDFKFSGILQIGELLDGNLEFNISLDGDKGGSGTNYLTHLHFGSYDEKDAAIAVVLNPVEATTLTSTTLLPGLSDGSTLKFEDLASFSGHVKIHLDKEGPDYNVILAAGNIGSPDLAEQPFDMANISMCLPGSVIDSF